MLRKGLRTTLAEAEMQFGRHGLTRDVRQEALRIVERRKQDAAAPG